jgi:hypothetical protein
MNGMVNQPFLHSAVGLEDVVESGVNTKMK